VTLGAYANVMAVLGLEIALTAFEESAQKRSRLPARVRVGAYPELKKLAWQMKDSTELTLEEVANLYERNWKSVDKERLTAMEREFIEQLLKQLGRSGLLV